MSVNAMAFVWGIDIPRDEKFVLLAYADHADHDGGSIYPAVATIAHKTGYSERQVQRITNKLVARRLLIPESERVGGAGKTTCWRIPIGGVGDDPLKKGDKMSPFPKKGDISAKKGDISAKKGDIFDEKGDTAMSPEPLTIINRQENRDGASAAAETAPREGRRFAVIYERGDVIRLLMDAAGMAALPPRESERIEQLVSLLSAYGYERVLAACREAIGDWRSRRRKNGLPYRVTNMGWVDWAQEILDGARSDRRDPDQMGVDELVQYYKEQGKL